MELVTDWDEFPNFSEYEFACHGADCCGGEAKIDRHFVSMLQQLRESIGHPLIIRSGYRCEVHNAKVQSTGPAHPSGKAVDILCHGDSALDLISFGSWRFQGIGVQQKGEHSKRFLHFDNLAEDEFPGVPRPWLWSY
jgi:hypothetical protein